MTDERNTIFEYLQVLKKAQTMIYGIKEPKPSPLSFDPSPSQENLHSENSDQELLASPVS
jgi:hypothetical protein